ncbi:hypothetical protein LQW54_004837 [Pestalotiopsis sp. IQ-011]
MRNLVPLLALVASDGMASPHSTISRGVTSLDVTTRDVTIVDEMTDIIAFAASQSNCDVLNCAAVVAAAVGITACIFIGGPGGVACVISSVAGGAKSGLDKFLEDNNVCPAN